MEKTVEVEFCFAYQNGKCKCLQVEKCRQENCAFYKPKGRHERERKKIIIKLLNLTK